MRILVILLTIILSTPAFAVPDKFVKEMHYQCINNGGIGLMQFKPGLTESCEDYLKDFTPSARETIPGKGMEVGTCDCKAENQCWSGKSCISYRKACETTLLAQCENEQQKKLLRYQNECPMHCRPSYQSSQKELEIRNSALCRHSNICGDKIPCMLVQDRCDKSFLNMCDEIRAKCRSLPE